MHRVAPKCGLINQLASTTPTIPVTVSGVVSADLHSCAILANGSVLCWGDNTRGELGDNLAEGATSVPVHVQLSGTASALAASAAAVETCALLTNGTVQCWGGDQFGQIGIPTTPATCPFGGPCQPVPVAVPGIMNATSVAVGGSFACAVTGGSVQCWGSNEVGELGNGTTADSNTPVAVSGINNAISVSAGSSHACAVLVDGTVRCWGDNSSGQLGNGTTSAVNTPNSTPVAVAGITGAIATSLGDSHSCAVLSSGEVKCWGSNEFSQIGTSTGDTTSCLFPPCVLTPVTVFTGGTAVSAGSLSTCVLIAGSVQCLGDNRNGQLGNGTTNPSNTPVTVSGLASGATGISNGASHACASLSTGQVACWGDNTLGDLGDGTCPDPRNCVQSTVPVFVALPP